MVHNTLQYSLHSRFLHIIMVHSQAIGLMDVCVSVVYFNAIAVVSAR